MSQSPTPARNRTFNLPNMNEAQNALQRATQLMGIIDLHESTEERRAIQSTIDSELALVTALISQRHAPYPERK